MQDLIRLAVILLLTWIAVHTSGCSNNGIIIIEDYPHAVAICGQEKPNKIIVNEAIFISDGVATYTINRGHENDPEVQELMSLAKIECNNL